MTHSKLGQNVGTSTDSDPNDALKPTKTKKKKKEWITRDVLYQRCWQHIVNLVVCAEQSVLAPSVGAKITRALAKGFSLSPQSVETEQGRYVFSQLRTPVRLRERGASLRG